jgi:two-component system LytT family response regulator
MNHRTVLVDDEAKSTDILKFMLEKYCPDMDIVGVFNDPLKALEYIRTNTIDLLFLDIQMPYLDGFQLLDKLTDIDFKVVFVTAYDEYALRAFKYYAIDYILKPIELGEIKELSKHLQQLEKAHYNKADYMQIFDKMSSAHGAIEHLAVPTSSGVVFVFFDDIKYLHADSNYTDIIKKDNSKVYASKTLKYFENLLPSDLFFRCHQSYIVNLRFLDKFVKSDGGYLLMLDGTKIALSRSRKQVFSDRYLK